MSCAASARQRGDHHIAQLFQVDNKWADSDKRAKRKNPCGSKLRTEIRVTRLSSRCRPPLLQLCFAGWYQWGPFILCRVAFQCKMCKGLPVVEAAKIPETGTQRGIHFSIVHSDNCIFHVPILLRCGGSPPIGDATACEPQASHRRSHWRWLVSRQTRWRKPGVYCPECKAPRVASWDHMQVVSKCRASKWKRRSIQSDSIWMKLSYSSMWLCFSSILRDRPQIATGGHLIFSSELFFWF